MKDPRKTTERHIYPIELSGLLAEQVDTICALIDGALPPVAIDVGKKANRSAVLRHLIALGAAKVLGR